MIWFVRPKPMSTISWLPSEPNDHLARALIVIAPPGVARDIDLSYTGVVSREAQNSGLGACEAVIEADPRAASDRGSIERWGSACGEQDSHHQDKARTSHPVHAERLGDAARLGNRTQ